MRRQKVMKSFDKLEYRDDFMFGKVMEDTELCRDVLECLLQRPVGELKELQTQKEFRYTSDGKPMRLDVYNEDDDGQIYDAEMQNRNNMAKRLFLISILAKNKCFGLGRCACSNILSAETRRAFRQGAPDAPHCRWLAVQSRPSAQ